MLIKVCILRIRVEYDTTFLAKITIILAFIEKSYQPFGVFVRDFRDGILLLENNIFGACTELFRFEFLPACYKVNSEATAIVIQKEWQSTYIIRVESP
ncbi:unnamed protein product [Phyllotreta striolata]|uniref:Uncharacterized protein n=1 Tax=Phyllotreta striolata TaxID=444603 RepID=A0A9N9XSD7_PHYSR|nr:unnamed protein product [Phyllotreta striolata]